MALAEIPPGIALLERRPCHDIFRITSFDGSKRVVSVTSVPLFSQADRLVGMLSVFWEQPEVRGS